MATMVTATTMIETTTADMTATTGDKPDERMNLTVLLHCIAGEESRMPET